jgi:deoxyribose-phosphate aldolase
VLEFLKGMPWDVFAMNYVYGLRPSRVRTSTGMLKCDAHVNRVTVMLEQDGVTIQSIEQEVEIGLLGGFDNGYDLDCELRARQEKEDNE